MDFDIFISFKATHHEPTDDSKYAKQLYDELTKQGYSEFDFVCVASKE